jgi:Flp pilus assembly protein CpaB
VIEHALERAPRASARRLNSRLVAGLLLTLLAFSGFVAFASRLIPETRTLLVAARDLPAGVPLGADDVVVSRLAVDDTVYNAALPGDALESVAGRALSTPAYAGQVLVRAQLQPADRPLLGPDQVALTIPARPDNTVATLAAGDHVQVLAAFDKGKPTARTEVVLADAPVFRVGRGDAALRPAAGPGGPTLVGAPGADPQTGPISSVTLVVPTGEPAAALTSAAASADLQIGLLPGPRPPRP